MKLALALTFVSLSVLACGRLHHVPRADHRHKKPHKSGTILPSTTSLPDPTDTTLPSDGLPMGSSTHSLVAPVPTESSYPGAQSNVSSNGWQQISKGSASFTVYTDCGEVACGQKLNGFSAAVNTLTYGSTSGAGGACGRCFRISPTKDAYNGESASQPGKSIVVKVNDECPIQGNEEFCGQTVSNPLNQHGMSVHFDLCETSGASHAFFTNSEAMLGTFEEVSCDEWSGSNGQKYWSGSCLAGETAQLWPTPGGCPNHGTPPP